MCRSVTKHSQMIGCLACWLAGIGSGTIDANELKVTLEALGQHPNDEEVFLLISQVSLLSVSISKQASMHAKKET